MRWTIEDEFTGCTLEQYLEMYYSQEFSDMIAKATKLSTRELVEKVEGADGRIMRRVRIVPDIPVPKAFQKIINGPVAYDEVSYFDPKTTRATFEIDHKGPKRIQHKGEYIFSSTDKGVKRVMVNECNVGIPLVGRKAEKAIQSEVVKSFAKIAKLTQEQIDIRFS